MATEVNSDGDAPVAARAVAARGATAPDGEERDGFRFRGGRLALDLPATVMHRLGPAPVDLLASPRDLGRWFLAAALVAEAPPVGAHDLAAAHSLREALHDLAQAVVAGRKLPPAAVAQVAQAAASAPPPPPRLLAAGESAPPRSADPPALLSAVARDAIDLFGGPDAARVRVCEHADCALLFLDSSRGRARRWCSMAACGNRAKAAGFRRRARAQAAE